jgi:hypothetical protein
MQPKDDFDNLLVKYHRFWFLSLSKNLVQLKNLTREEIDALGEEQQNQLFLNWYTLVWNENRDRQKPILNRVLAFQNVARSITGILLFPQWIMDRFKEALDQYARGEWLSSIALCGAIVEFVVADFFEVDEYKQRIPVRDRTKTNNAKTNLLILKAYNILHEADYQRLDDVRKIRNSYIHPEKLRDTESQRGDNLVVLTKLCEFFDETNMKKYQEYFFYAGQLMRKLVGQTAAGSQS